ncbi:MAG: spore germination protein [Tumebacillaceae bacterium]
MFYRRKKKQNNDRQNPSPPQQTQPSDKVNDQADSEQSEQIVESTDQFLAQVKATLHDSADLMIRKLRQPANIALIYLSSVADTAVISDQILTEVLSADEQQVTPEGLLDLIPVTAAIVTSDFQQIIDSLLSGWAFLHLEGEQEGVLLFAAKRVGRSFSTAESENIVVGAQVAFVESLSDNTALVRRSIKHKSLCMEKMIAGTRTQSRLNVFYIKDLADEQNVQTVRQRIGDLEIDGVASSAVLAQLIGDNSLSIFPQFLLTERPDRVGLALLEGKIVILQDGSSQAIICPATFWDFLKSPEDHNIRWNISTFIRLLRTFGVIASMFLTAAYVAALTYHYEVIPVNLLDSLAESRSKVPFPPLSEALLLEVIIELLREAGARLPSKVGQTMGIVGGIVIGEAAVQAGFTSNILIMLVALGALASFTAPSYILGMAVRFLRFPMILLAGLWGGIGIMVGACFLLLHLLRQTSLGNPFLWPLYPFRFTGFRYDSIRMPFQMYAKRSQYTRSADQTRFNKAKAMQRKDIDE